MLRRILRRCTRTRSSWRHPDYLRVSIRDYRSALLAYLEETAQEAIDALAAGDLLQDLRARLKDPKLQASQRLTQAALAGTDESDVMRLDAGEFNRAAEKYYRETLRVSQIEEAYRYLREDTLAAQRQDDTDLRFMMRCGVRVQDPVRFLDSIGERLLGDNLTVNEIASVLNLLLVFTEREARHSKMALGESL